jgi:hypothetical protein
MLQSSSSTSPVCAVNQLPRETFVQFCQRVTSEAAASTLAWRCKFAGKEFECPRCRHETFYQYRVRSELRECRACGERVRLRPGTLWANSKLPVLIWVRATFLVTRSRRDMSILEIQRRLGLRSYQTAYRLVTKLRHVLREQPDAFTFFNTAR